MQVKKPGLPPTQPSDEATAQSYWELLKAEFRPHSPKVYIEVLATYFRMRLSKKVNEVKSCPMGQALIHETTF